MSESISAVGRIERADAQSTLGASAPPRERRVARAMAAAAQKLPLRDRVGCNGSCAPATQLERRAEERPSKDRATRNHGAP